MNKEVFSLIEKFAKILQMQLNIEYLYQNKNIAMAFKGIGSFGELLAGLYNPNSVSYTHLTLPTSLAECRSRWSPYH